MVVLYAFIAFFAQRVVPYLGFFPYKELLVEFGLPTWISSLANFDGIHYLLIAKQNYSQWEQAFFPLYPLLIKATSFIVPNFLISALAISNICFAVGLIFFNKLVKVWKINSFYPALFLLTFPTAFYFGIVYTEGLFFMLFVLSLYFLHKKNYFAAGLFAALSSSTRLIGVFLLVPFFFHFLSLYKGKLKDFRISNFDFKTLRLSDFLTLTSPFLGLLSYMAYLWTTTGDPLFFFNSQPIYGANRSTHLIFLPQVYYRYLKILLTAAHDFQWYLSFFEMGIFTLVFAVLILDFLTIVKSKKISLLFLGLNIFSFINLVLPTLTGTFSSIPRYALFSLSFFLYLANIKSLPVKIGLITLFIFMQIALLSFFVQGYFVG
jgi:hypothetical protein